LLDPVAYSLDLADGYCLVLLLTSCSSQLASWTEPSRAGFSARYVNESSRAIRGCLLGWLWGSAAPLGAQSRVWLRFSLPEPGLRESNPPPPPGSLRTRESIVARGLSSARLKVADFDSLFYWSPALKCATNTIRGCPSWVGPERQTKWGGMWLPGSSWSWLGRWARLTTATVTNTP
jgi:hypothetical protein